MYIYYSPILAKKYQLSKLNYIIFSFGIMIKKKGSANVRGKHTCMSPVGTWGIKLNCLSVLPSASWPTKLSPSQLSVYLQLDLPIAYLLNQ